jgi:hypothetical protein
MKVYTVVFWEYILFRDVDHSGAGSAPELVPTNPGISSHQFLPYTESVTTNTYRFPESTTIPSDSALHQFPEFRPIPESHDYRTILLLHYRHLHPIPERNSGNRIDTELPGIPIDSGIPGIDSEIPNRNHTSALTLMHCDMLEGYSIWTQSDSGQEIRESDRVGIAQNSYQFRNSWPDLDYHSMQKSW